MSSEDITSLIQGQVQTALDTGLAEMKKSMEQLLTTMFSNMAATQQSSPPPATAATAPPPPVMQDVQTVQPVKGRKGAPPDNFDGNKSNTSTFLAQLYLYFMAERHKITTDEDKVTTCLSYMRGGIAGPWATLKVKEYANNTVPTWADFHEEFMAFFGDHDPAGTARDKMELLVQGQKTAEEYVNKFKEIMGETEYNDAALMGYFEKGLNATLVDRIYDMENMPTTLAKWMSKAIQFDRQHRQRKARKEKLLQGSPFSHSPKQSKPATTSVITPQTKAAPAGSASSQLPDIVPMEVDAGKKNVGKSIVCFKCRKPGHIAKNCTSSVNINAMDHDAIIAYAKEEMAKQEEKEKAGKDFM